MPDVLTAQRAHNRLAHRHDTKTADSAYDDAHRITRRWTQRYAWSEHRDRRLITAFMHRYERFRTNSIEIDVANYPETVALASILASEHWRSKAIPQHDDHPPDWAPNSPRRQFYYEVSRRLKIDYQPSGHDPLAGWITSKRLRTTRLSHMD